MLRQDGWIVLQYWLFYPFNDWRSGFFGANDHEADWEKIFIYLSESESGEVRPEWVAYAAHNYTGDNLSRRWDDPEVEKVGEHPVIYVGAGSHASYYAPGEYLTELTLPLPPPLARVPERSASLLEDKLGQYVGDDKEKRRVGLLQHPLRGLRARGRPERRERGQTGRGTTPGSSRTRSRRGSRATAGLWGLYARDPFEGEDAPAGPMYNRDKTVSPSLVRPRGLGRARQGGSPDRDAGGRTRTAGRHRLAVRRATGPRSTRRAGS